MAILFHQVAGAVSIEDALKHALAARIAQRLNTLGLILPAPPRIPPGVILPFGWVRIVGTRALISGHDQVPLVGSVALNFNCGGLDDHGVRAGLSGWKHDVTGADPDEDRFVVWMPTMCCEAHLRCYDRRDISTAWGVKAEYTRFYAEGTGYTLDRKDAAKMAAVDRALELIKKHDLILATGHLDRQETLTIVERAHVMAFAGSS